MSAQGFKSVYMVGAIAAAALGCYLVSLRVASERAELESVENKIVLAQRDIRLLNTEIGTRGRLAQLERCTRSLGELIVLDLREEETIHAGNRFAIYALYPMSTISVHVLWGKQQQNTVLAVGKSILDRTSTVDIGALMLSYGGGGHLNAGTCQVDHAEAGRVLDEIAVAVNAAEDIAA